MKKILDVRGLLCPKPVIEVKKAIESKEFKDFEVVSNSEVSKENIVRFLKSNNINSEVFVENDEYHIIFSIKNEQELKEFMQESVSCKTINYTTNLIVSRNKLGDGDEKLGQILMRSFFQALLEIDKKPAKIFFVNSGVFLTVKDSPVIEEIKKLAQNSVQIFSCGTCLDFYNLKSDIAVGEVGNMYILLEMLMNDGKII